MKTNLQHHLKQLIANPSLIKAGWSLLRKGGYFIFFPYYWELIPIRLEKAIAGKKNEAIGRN